MKPACSKLVVFGCAGLAPFLFGACSQIETGSAVDINGITKLLSAIFGAAAAIAALMAANFKRRISELESEVTALKQSNLKLRGQLDEVEFTARESTLGHFGDSLANNVPGFGPLLAATLRLRMLQVPDDGPVGEDQTCKLLNDLNKALRHVDETLSTAPAGLVSRDGYPSWLARLVRRTLEVSVNARSKVVKKVAITTLGRAVPWLIQAKESASVCELCGNILRGTMGHDIVSTAVSALFVPLNREPEMAAQLFGAWLRLAKELDVTSVAPGPPAYIETAYSSIDSIGVTDSATLVSMLADLYPEVPARSDGREVPADTDVWNRYGHFWALGVERHFDRLSIDDKARTVKLVRNCIDQGGRSPACCTLRTNRLKQLETTLNEELDKR